MFIATCRCLKGILGLGGESSKNKLKDTSFIFPMTNVTIFTQMFRCAEQTGISSLLHIPRTLGVLFIKLHPHAPFSRTMCKIYDLVTHTQCQGQTSRTWNLAYNLCPLHISWIQNMIFIKLHSNVPVSETVCRAHDPAT